MHVTRGVARKAAAREGARMRPIRAFWPLALAFALLLPRGALATMPLLSDEPSSRTPATCQTWAGKQDEEALEMWGVMKDGGTSRDVGVMRLTLTCLGDEQPEIVGFGSSAGYDESFCAKHADWGVCRKETKRDTGAPACLVEDPTPTPLNFRTSPNGRILGSLGNGQTVTIMDTTVDGNGRRWAFISDGNGTTLGWAFQGYIRCGRP